MLPDDMGMTAVLIARSGIAGGLAMAAAGVLCAELLRRSVAAGRSALPDRHSGRGRIEVTHPPELRTLAPTHATGGDATETRMSMRTLHRGCTGRTSLRRAGAGVDFALIATAMGRSFADDFGSH